MVNLEELSAKELYELARKKEQEEALQEQLLGRIHELETTREQLKTAYEEELKEIEERLEELAVRRQAAIDKHKDELNALNLELEKLIQEVKESQLAVEQASSAEEEVKQAQLANQHAEKPEIAPEKEIAEAKAEEEPTPVEEATPAAEKPAEEPAPTAKPAASKSAIMEEEMEVMMQHVTAFMKGRAYISESLMKEKLQAAKFRPSTNFNKLLDTLVKQARLVRRNGNNYVLGRAKGKK